MKYLLVVATLLSQMAFADSLQTSPQTVIATCENTKDHAPAFQILGDMTKFSGPRVTVQSDAVELKDGKGLAFFTGKVTLTKSAPYQFFLYGKEDGKKENDMMEQEAFGTEATAILYGWSFGKKLFVTEFKTDKTVGHFVCVLSPDLLTSP